MIQNSVQGLPSDSNKISISLWMNSIYPNNLTNRIENLLISYWIFSCQCIRIKCNVMSWVILIFGEILLFNIFRDASGIKLKRTLSNKKN